MKKSLFLLISVLFSILLIVGLGSFFYWQKTKSPPAEESVNYLIPGVPYYGYYTHLLSSTNVSRSIAFSMASIFAYWGEDGQFFTPESLVRVELLETPELGVLNKPFLTFLDRFEYGHPGYGNPYGPRFVARSLGEAISSIKQFVNSEKKIPILVHQKFNADPENDYSSYRVIIGLFEDEKKLVVHDWLYGNNYEISFEDFEKMFLNDMIVFVPVWPSDESKVKNTHTRNMSTVYPKKSEVMDKLKGFWDTHVETFTGVETDILEYKKMADDVQMELIPPPYRIIIYTVLAEKQMDAGDFDGAIATLEERIMPLNHDLNQVYGLFAGNLKLFKNLDCKEYKFGFPYALLAKAYLKNKNFVKAGETVKEGMEAICNEETAYSYNLLQAVLDEL